MKNFFIAGNQIDGDRDYQEDYFETEEFDDGSAILVLSDGMGGYAGGKEASRIVVQSFKDVFSSKKTKSYNLDIEDALRISLVEANEALKEAKVKTSKFSKMGTTLIAVYLKDDYIQWVSVGDSPLWLISKSFDDGIKRINKNHSIAGLLELQYKHGEISKEERDTSPNRHMLTSAIIGYEIKSIDLSKPLKISKDDILILASDGIETLAEEEVKDIALKNRDNMQSLVKEILDAIISKKSPEQDNSTLVVITNRESEPPKEEHKRDR